MKTAINNPVQSFVRYWLDSDSENARGHLYARWVFLRCLGLIFLSAFYSWYFQADGLIGPRGILPAGEYLSEVAAHLGLLRYWLAPTLLWIASGTTALKVLCGIGLAGSVLLTFNMFPRAMAALCTVVFLSFISAARDFSSYQSDGMLLEAGMLCVFLAPRGFRPGFGDSDRPPRAAVFLLQWEWFRIYFESGLAKMLSGDVHWRHLTAMDDYYQNGPLPTWIGWYAQQLPHAFHAATALWTLVIELAVVWMLFLPARFRRILFWILLSFQIGIILTANYTFLNYLVLCLSVFLLDDGYVVRIVRIAPGTDTSLPRFSGTGIGPRVWRWLSGIYLGWVFYATTELLILMVLPGLPMPTAPIVALEPFRVANRYGLFAVMTPARYEIEFEGTADGKTWRPYRFRYKPQDLSEPPQIYAPYQPRLDWNLWFASLGTWREYPWVVRIEERLLENDSSVLSLFRDNPFPSNPPRQVRAAYWQYWFTTLATRRRDGRWWRRESLGLYAPALERRPDGQFAVVAMPSRA